MNGASGWASPPDRPRLGAGDVHVWRVDLEPGSSQMCAGHALLAPDERERARRFHAAADRDRFVTARVALRTILGLYLGAPPRDLRFRYGLHGKPSLEGGHAERSLRFNLAHSGGVGLCAVALGREIGVDVERIRPELAEERVAEQFFAPDEVSALRGLPPEAWLKAFFEIWTCKEAYVKALGLGLSAPLRAFSVAPADSHFADPKTAKVESERGPPALSIRAGAGEARGWSLRTLSLRPGYAAALAVEGAACEVALWRRAEESGTGSGTT